MAGILNPAQSAPRLLLLSIVLGSVERLEAWKMYSFNEMHEGPLQTLLSSSGQMVSIQMSKLLLCMKKLSKWPK